MSIILKARRNCSCGKRKPLQDRMCRSCYALLKAIRADD